KADVAFRESGGHVKPSDVLADPARVAQRLRAWPGVAMAAFQVELAEGLSQVDAEAQFKAIARLARVLAAPVLSVPAAPLGSDFEVEVNRLTGFSRIATADGVTCAVETR